MYQSPARRSLYNNDNSGTTHPQKDLYQMNNFRYSVKTNYLPHHIRGNAFYTKYATREQSCQSSSREAARRPVALAKGPTKRQRGGKGTLAIIHNGYEIDLCIVIDIKGVGQIGLTKVNA